jgi:hypothetical protein
VWEELSFFTCSKTYFKSIFYVIAVFSCIILIVKACPWLTEFHRLLVIGTGAALSCGGPKIPIGSLCGVVRLLLFVTMLYVIAAVACDREGITAPEWYAKYSWVVTAALLLSYTTILCIVYLFKTKNEASIE